MLVNFYTQNSKRHQVYRYYFIEYAWEHVYMGEHGQRSKCQLWARCFMSFDRSAVNGQQNWFSIHGWMFFRNSIFRQKMFHPKGRIHLFFQLHGPLAWYVKLRVVHAFSPPPWASVPDMHHGMCVRHVSWCMPGSLTSVFLRSRWRRKSSQHSRHMRNPQFYVSGKRSVQPGTDTPYIMV